MEEIINISFDKAIKSGKEHRKPYTGAQAIDKTCRNHGGCIWCEENRLYRFKNKQNAADYALKEEKRLN